MTQKKKVVLLSLITVLIWGFSFSVTKISQEHFPPNALGFFRCFFATLTLLIVGKIKHISLPKKKDVPLFLLAGAFGFTLYLVTFNTGILTLSVATSSIVLALSPILTAVFASFLYKEKISVIGWLAIGSAFIGVTILLLWDGILSINVGLIWTLIASILFCSYNLMNRYLLTKGYTSLEVATYSVACGAILFLFATKQSIEAWMTATPLQISATIFLGVFSSGLTYVLWGMAFSLAKRTSEVTNFLFLSPLISTIFGFLLLNEIPNNGTFIGGGIIIISLVVFNMKSLPKEVATESPID